VPPPDVCRIWRVDPAVLLEALRRLNDGGLEGLVGWAAE
jgi:hypothetical protein